MGADTKHDDDISVHIAAAREMLAGGRYDEALEQLESIAALPGGRTEEGVDEMWMALATAYLAKTAQSGDIPAYKKCRHAYQRAYAVTERKRDLMVEMAEQFVQAGYYNEAEEALGYALLHAPGDKQIEAFMAEIAQWKEFTKRAGSIW